jgi:hypothetical protein
MNKENICCHFLRKNILGNSSFLVRKKEILSNAYSRKGKGWYTLLSHILPKKLGNEFVLEMSLGMVDYETVGDTVDKAI